MISEAERSRSSQSSNDGSLTSQGSSVGKAAASPSSPLASSSQAGNDSDDFVNKVCKFEMISRGKTSSTPTKGPTMKSLTVKTPTSKSPPQDGKLPSPTSPFGGLPGAFIGEKVFTRDTATTRVSASLLQGLGKERVSSTVSTNSSNSLTSVSTLSWSSDVSESFAGSVKGNTTPHSGKSPEVMTTSDPGFLQTKTPSSSSSSPASTSSTTPHDLDGGSTKETFIFPNLKASGGSKRGGIIDLGTGTSTTAASGHTFPQQQQQPLQPSGTTKKFVTLSASSREYPAPVVKPLPSSPSAFPFISSNNVSDIRSPIDSSSPVLVNGETANSPNALNHDSPGSGGDSSRGGGHRNTFEGMDFEFSELTAQQKELALKHREVVAERKLEQEREKKDRQRLDEILKMCEEYQNEISGEINTTPTHAHTKAPFGFSAQQLEPTFRRIQSPGPLELPDESASSPVNSLDRRDHGGNVSRIKTNGSLILNSPGSAHKELGGFSFPAGASSGPVKTGSTASLAYSSNSEDETIGSSEDTGTIKKRPNIGETLPALVKQQLPLPHQKHEQPKQFPSQSKPTPTPHLTIGHNAITMTADISDDNMIITTTNNFMESVTITLPDHSPSASSDNSITSSPKSSPGASGLLQTQKPHKDTSGADWFINEHASSLAVKTLENGYHTRLNTDKPSEPVTEISFGDSVNSDCPAASSFETSQEKAQGHLFSEGAQNSLGSNNSLPGSNILSKRESSNSLAKESHSSTSSSQTLRDSSNHSSRASSFSSNVAMDTKEDTPTPVNSDSEQGERSSTRSEQLSLLLSTTSGAGTPIRSSADALSPKEVCFVLKKK